MSDVATDRETRDIHLDPSPERRAAEVAAAKEALRLKHEERAEGVTRNQRGRHAREQ